ncbi:unnamed protein product, partial [Amoebophrya sp. A120]|eukprot:GSA120T00021581001.1
MRFRAELGLMADREGLTLPVCLSFCTAAGGLLCSRGIMAGGSCVACFFIRRGLVPRSERRRLSVYAAISVRPGPFGFPGEGSARGAVSVVPGCSFSFFWWLSYSFSPHPRGRPGGGSKLAHFIVQSRR